MLFRCCRGTGIEGLRGMSSRRPSMDGSTLSARCWIVRRRDVLAYLEANGLAYRLDSSNHDTTVHAQPPAPRVDSAARARIQSSARSMRCAGWPGKRTRCRRKCTPRGSVAGARRIAARRRRCWCFALDVLTAASPHRGPGDVSARMATRAMAEARWALTNGNGWWRSSNGDAIAWDLPGGVHVRRAERVIQLTGRRAGSPKVCNPSLRSSSDFLSFFVHLGEKLQHVEGDAQRSVRARRRRA